MELSVTFASDVESNGSSIGKIGNRGRNSRGGEGDSSDEDDLSFSFSSTGRGGSRPNGRGRRPSIGSIRFADDDEVSRREEEENEHQVDAESKRTEIVSYAEKTHNLIGFVIIDMIHMNHIDSVVVGRLSDLFLTLQKNNISLAIARPRPQVLRYLITGRFVKLIGQDFVVDSVHTAVIRCNAVLRAARQFQVQKLISAESSSTQSAQTTSSEPGSQSPSPNSSYTLIKPVTKGNDDKHEVAINMPVAQGKAAVDEHHIEDDSADSTTSSTDEDSPV
jgi:anti-anti-sigma regulatory factor